jgi:hypothetical protein
MNVSASDENVQSSSGSNSSSGRINKAFDVRVSE